MTLHKEGTALIISSFSIFAVLNGLLFYFSVYKPVTYFLAFATAIVFLIILQFFRVPIRHVTTADSTILSPADGKVVVIEEVEETEYFKDKRILVSVFMSPFNVHINWTPTGGKISYYKYHPGLFLAAWLPKSSTDNERTTTVIKRPDGQEVLFRQVAGALAKRIKTYTSEGDEVGQAHEFGFIKFGSRVDIYLPLNAEILVNLEDKVTGTQSILANLPVIV